MKKTTSVSFSRILSCCLLLTALFIFASCEKHDGVYYFKKKCTANMNGISYIDQHPFSPSPDVLVTPELILDDNSIEFFTLLSKERGGDIEISAEIRLYLNADEEFLSRRFDIQKVEIEYADDKQTYYEYTQYCHEHNISYAVVNDEVVESGVFQLTSYNEKYGLYYGKFTLSTSSGTLNGEFMAN